ncbi:RNA polymerase beta subunit, partial [Chlamydia psittaci 06-1683]
KNG